MEGRGEASCCEMPSLICQMSCTVQGGQCNVLYGNGRQSLLQLPSYPESQHNPLKYTDTKNHVPSLINSTLYTCSYLGNNFVQT